MKGFTLGAAAAVSTLLFNGVLADVDPIVIKGSKFFYKTNGTQFYIRGVAYQPDYQAGGSNGTKADNTGYTDPLADGASCKRDLPYLQQLRTNTVRVYAINPTSNHDDCMNAFANAGIYVIADLSDPSESINREDPSWNTELFARYASVVDALAPYSNTLGFFAGNEVTNNITNTEASAYVRAAVRDMKTYISSKNYRTIGVGYASDDDANIRADESDYMNCGDTSSAIDFWGYNIYEWCGHSTFALSGYQDRTTEFSNYSVPVFFAEYGCITKTRYFEDTPVLYGPDMENVWSGGIVFSYFQETNGYGLISLNGNNVSPNADFTALSSQIATVSPTGTQMSAYTPSNQPRSCPSLYSGWEAKASPLPKSPNQNLCQCMYDALSCVVTPSTPEKDYGDIFGYICGNDNNACKGILSNATTGNFGQYSMCNTTQQLAYAMNEYYMDQGSSASACSFGGSATLKSATSPTGSCSSLISQAGGLEATGTTDFPPQGTANAQSGSHSGTGNAASGRMGSPVSGTWQMVTLGTVAFVSGMGMILL